MAGDWPEFEKLYADRLGEQVERLADHAVRGQLNDKAVQYLRQAGAKAAARSALLDARSSYEKALDLLKSQPDSQAAMEQAFEIHSAASGW
jgi:predicted ATPase